MTGVLSVSPQKNFFIGRDEELQLIRSAIKSERRSSQIFLIRGPSGIGKSRLLQEIPKSIIDKRAIKFTTKFDCYETFAHTPFSVEGHIAKQLGPFENFDSSINDWYKNRWAGFGINNPTAFMAVRESFLSDYNSIARRFRIVLFFDTVEVSLRSDLWERLIELAPQLDNTILILAGQDFGNTKAELEDKFRSYNNSLTFINLNGLKENDIDLFIRHYGENTNFSNGLKQNIKILTKGRPVLLTLALEWLRRSLPLKELEGDFPSDTTNRKDVNLENLRQEFERSVIKSILSLSNSIDQAILLMAWVSRRFDVNILQKLFGLTKIDAQVLLKELKSLPFIRILPNGVCVLHDNVRDLVVKYDWPFVDPDGSYRKHIDEQMVRFYEDLIDKQIKLISNMRSDISIETNNFENHQERIRKLIDIETQRWINEAEKLFYSLRCNAEKGVGHFVQSFDEISNYNLDLRELLVYEIADHDSAWFENLSSDSQYFIQYRLGIAKADASNSKDAFRIFDRLRKLPSLSDSQIINLSLQLGNATLSLGNITDAELLYKNSLSLSLHTKNSIEISESYLSLAGVNRVIGKWEKAIEYYSLGLEYISTIDTVRNRLEVEAWLSNGLAYAYHLLGKDVLAEKNCMRALDIWRDLNSPLQLGSILSTLGEVKTGQDKFDEAMIYYNQALSIFQEHRAWEWQVIVYHQMAYSCWHNADLENAWIFLLRSRKLASERNIVKELPTIYHRLGLLVLDDYGDFREASKHFERGGEESKKQNTIYMLLENLVALMDIAYRTHDEDKLRALARQVRSELQKSEFRYPLVEGRVERILAQWFFDRKEYNASLRHYKDAIPMIAQHGGFGRYRLSTEIIFLKSHLAELDKDIAAQWARNLYDDWSERDVFHENTGVLDFLKEYL